MATIKSFTSLEQSKKLAEILPIESADMFHFIHEVDTVGFGYKKDAEEFYSETEFEYLPCWSLAALLKYLSEIKPQVYTPVLFPSEGKWILQFVEYGHGNVCEVYYDNPVDACVAMIEKLNESNLL